VFHYLCSVPIILQTLHSLYGILGFSFVNMIQPVAAGKLFSVYSASGSSDFASQEQKAIAELERTRKAMLALQAGIQRSRAEGQGDANGLSEQLKTAQNDYNAARSTLASLRSGRRAENVDEQKKQTPSLNTYLERRSFAREFPDDAQMLKSYQIYDRSGNKTVFSSSYLQFLGSTVDVRI
jgi:hypothetical protein